MRATNRVSVSAPADLVWSVFADVERWPAWTRSVTSIEPLDGGDVELGHRFRIRQPWLPVLVWQVTDVRPGHSWRWAARSFGARTDAWHQVVPDGEAAAVVTQGVEQRGPLGVVAGLLARPLIRRYMALEAQGLKRTSEERARGVPPG